MSNTTNTTIIIVYKFISNKFKFWSYLIFLIPSFFCTLFALYIFLFDRNQRRALNNHVLIILLLTVLLCEVTMYPWMLYYYINGNNWQRSFLFCQIWAFIDWAIYLLQIMLFAWATMERHILIFHDLWLATSRQRFFLHYLPLIFILIYYIVFYIVVYFFPPCENFYIENSLICMNPCMYDSVVFSMYETIVNYILPSFTIVLFSLFLLLRVFRQKQRMRQAITWRRHRKMTVQLLSISFLYLVVTCPNGFITFLSLCGLSDYINNDIRSLSIYLCYYIVLLFPFVTIFSNPELNKKFREMFRLKKTLIRPENVPVARTRFNP